AIALHKHRTEIARPAAISWEPEEYDAGKVNTHASQNSSRLFFVRFRIHQNAHRLSGSNFADDLTVDPGDGSELAGPIAEVVRPPDPGGFVWFPFGGQTIPKRRRRGATDSRPRLVPTLSPLGERVDRAGVFFSRGRPGEGVLSLHLPFACPSYSFLRHVLSSRNR